MAGYFETVKTNPHLAQVQNVFLQIPGEWP